MDDVAPELLEQISKVFTDNMAQNERLAALLETIKNGSTSYADAQVYADLLGGCLSDALQILSSDHLPDGKLYYNIAERLLTPLLQETHTLASDAAVLVQTTLNTNAGIGIKAQRAAFDASRAQGIIDKVSDAPIFDDAKWVLQEPLHNFSMASVDNTLKANVDFQGKAGLSPKIIRKAEFKCCEWCNKLEGTYSYPNLPKDVYRRHERCRCTVEYDPGTGKRQNVHTKKTLSAEEVEARDKRIALSKKETTSTPRDFRRFTENNLATAPTQLLPNWGNAKIPTSKLSGYSLNMLHPGGKYKAIVFRDALGYTIDNEQELISAIQAGISKWKATMRPQIPQGQPFQVKMLLSGPNGKQATVKTGWIIENGQVNPRLTSAYVYTSKE